MNNIKQKYINSAMLLMVTSVIVKAISAVYKIPLTAYIGATGRGYFNMAYNLYMPVHAVIMGAFPVALTHLVSKYNEQGNNAKVYSLKKASGRLFFIIGIIGTAIMLLMAKPYAEIVSSSSKSVATIFMLAPTVLFSSMAASKRSFAEGHMNMVPTSVSQIIEAVFKMVFGLLFAKYTMSTLYNTYLESGAVLGNICTNDAQALSLIYPLTSAAAIGGVTVGAFLSFIYSASYVSIKYNSHSLSSEYKTNDSIKEIIVFSAPIILSTLIQSISEFLDTASVQYCLSLCDTDKLKAAYSECLKINETPESDMITYIYGLFSSAHDLKNLIPGFTMALGVAAVPALSAAFEEKEGCHLSLLVNSIFKYTSLIAFGGGFFLSLTCEFILKILYQSSNYDIVIGCTELVRFYGFITILYSLSGAVVFSVQAVGCASKSIPCFLISTVIRIALNYVLVSDARFNIYGAVFADAAAYIIILVCNMHILRKNTGVSFSCMKIFVKPFICSISAYFLSYHAYNSLFSFESSLAEFVVLSSFYLIIFTLFVILSKTIEFSELKTLQYCKKVA